MATIHGLSHKALHHMRKEGAALAVYWVYCARTNNEGVAWPSLRGLAHDTGWSRVSCAEARGWLTAHGALEQLDEYIRPTWRELPEPEKRRKVNLDRAEYYRLTGVLVVGDERYDLLYFGGHTKDNVEDDDGLVARPSTSLTIKPVGQNLIPVTELDSSKETLAPRKKRAGKTTIPAEVINPVKDAIAAAFGWHWETMTKAATGEIQAAAKQLCEAGYTAADVPGIYQHCGRFDSFGPMALAKHAPEWRKKQPTPAPNGHTEPEPPAAPIETPDFKVFYTTGLFAGMYKTLVASGDYDRMKAEGLIQ